MNIRAIEQRDVSIPGRPKHYEFTVILENNNHARVNVTELLDFSRCQISILEQTGYLVELPFQCGWIAFLKANLERENESRKCPGHN